MYFKLKGQQALGLYEFKSLWNEVFAHQNWQKKSKMHFLLLYKVNTSHLDIKNKLYLVNPIIHLEIFIYNLRLKS